MPDSRSSRAFFRGAWERIHRFESQSRSRCSTKGARPLEMEEKRERADCLSGGYAREAKRGECEASAGQAWKRGKGICRNASWRHWWDVVGGILAGLIGRQRGGTGREREGRMHVHLRRYIRAICRELSRLRDFVRG